jgi:phosphatidate cytidylyltransferase
MAVYPAKPRINLNMFLKRVLASVVIAVVAIPAVIFGGMYYFLLMVVFVGLASWEYVNLFKAAQYQASMPLVVGGTLLILGLRGYYPEFAPAALAFLVLAAMAWHLFAYEKGRDLAAGDFAVTVGGFIYLGWIGAYLLDLRFMENGMWWFWLVLPSALLADTAAYFVGKAFGKTQLAPRLSPKKTWEGYWAGVVFGTIGTAGLAILWHKLGGLDVTWVQGGAIGIFISVLAPLGDVGESMIKRQAGMKDSSNIIPGHGGFFDRIDSWLWAAVLGYYLVTWFIH